MRRSQLILAVEESGWKPSCFDHFFTGTMALLSKVTFALPVPNNPFSGTSTVTVASSASKGT